MLYPGKELIEMPIIDGMPTPAIEGECPSPSQCEAQDTCLRVLSSSGSSVCVNYVVRVNDNKDNVIARLNEKIKEQETLIDKLNTTNSKLRNKLETLGSLFHDLIKLWSKV